MPAAVTKQLRHAARAMNAELLVEGHLRQAQPEIGQRLGILTIRRQALGQMRARRAIGCLCQLLLQRAQVRRDIGAIVA